MIGLNYCPNSPCHQYGGNQEQPANNENWLPNPFGPDLATDPHPADQDDHPKYYEHQDLAAQEIMAEATKWIVILTAVSLALSTVGAGAIVWTLLESRKVTSAAREANQIMLSEQRPWITIEASKNEPNFVEGLPHGISFEINIKNEGRSPAYNVAVRTEIIESPQHRGFVDAETFFADAFNDGLNSRRFQRNRSGMTILPSKEIFDAKTISTGVVSQRAISDGKLSLAVAVTYFSSTNPAKFTQRKDGGMFQMDNFKSSFRTYCILDFVEDSKGKLHLLSDVEFAHFS